jgi:Uma2 family endonuclease
MASVPRTTYTLADYLALEERSQVKHQYLAGEVFAMAGGSVAHNLICENLFAELRAGLQGRDCRARSSELRIKVEETGLYTYPDVSVVCKPIHREAGAIETVLNPRILIEVLSPSTEAFDRTTKLTHYRKIASLQEMLLVSQHEPVIEHHIRRSENNEWLLKVVSGLDAAIEFPSIACRLAFSQIYADVDFSQAEQPPPLGELP